MATTPEASPDTAPESFLLLEYISDAIKQNDTDEIKFIKSPIGPVLLAKRNSNTVTAADIIIEYDGPRIKPPIAIEHPWRHIAKIPKSAV